MKIERTSLPPVSYGVVVNLLQTSMSGRGYSIVEYYAEHEGYRCGYCSSTDTNYSHGKQQMKIFTSLIYQFIIQTEVNLFTF